MQTPLFSLWKRPASAKKVSPWLWGLFGLPILLLSGVLSSTQARAGTLPGSPTPAELDPNLGLTTLDVLLKLGIVIGLIYLSLYFLRRWQGKISGRATRQLSVIESLSLSPRQSLHLVRAGSQVLLIGATDQTLTSLTPVELLPEPVAVAVPEQPAPSLAHFSSYLTQALSPAFAPVKVRHDSES